MAKEKKPKRSKTSGAAKVRAAGKKQLNLAVTQEDYEILKKASELARLPFATWMRLALIGAAIDDALNLPGKRTKQK